VTTWERVLIHDVNGSEGADFRSRVEGLIARQKAQWPLLRDNLRKLGENKGKTVELHGFPIYVHCHPHRIESTTARVDDVSIRQRACKLCVEQLFDGQEGIACGDRFVILCNPYPVLDKHLTIVDRMHVEQAIAGRLAPLLRLSEALGESFVVFYNGPQCGASAPDHFHVQAVPRSGVPIFDHLAAIERNSTQAVQKKWIAGCGGGEAFTLDGYHVRLIVFRGNEAAALAQHVQQSLDEFAGLTGTSREPLVNILITFDRPDWCVYLFPRARHRPACYLDGTLTVSPASLDMGGCFVVPVEEHFDRIGVAQLAEVFAEVTLPAELFGRLVRSLER
jgi:hypothetical protein